jgi:hypothetical protein
MVQVALLVLVLTVCELQAPMVLPSDRNETLPEIGTTAVPAAGATVAVNVTGVFSAGFALLEITDTVVFD